MKTIFRMALMFFVLFLGVSLIASTTVFGAGQVVTEEYRTWAKEVLEQEEALETVSAPNTVAVLYFRNKTGSSKLDLLQKGLTVMLITDLSKVKRIKLVERVKVQALRDELGLVALTQSGQGSRVGKILGVQHLVGGDILKSKIEEFQLRSDLLKVLTEEIFGQATADGELLEGLFKMEKDLLFQIIEELGIELTAEEERELRKYCTNDLQALLYYFEGIEYSDRGDYGKAREFNAIA